jgi:hypothetical protein
MDLMGLEENADFWNMGIDDADEEIMPIKDLTQQQSPPRSGTTNSSYLLTTFFAGGEKRMAQKPDTRKPTSKTAPAILQALDRNPELLKLPNGNYQWVSLCLEPLFS